MRLAVLVILTILLVMGLHAAGQELSSSLYSTGDDLFGDPFAAERGGEQPAPGQQTDARQLSGAITEASFTAVPAPPPHTFGLQDLVTIIVREDTQTDFSATLETEKESEFTGEIAEFPRLTLSDLLRAQVTPSSFPEGSIELDVTGESEFTGEGEYSNQQTLTARLQATIIDIKPNGNIVLEARKSIRSDSEQYTLVAVGTCRADDITATNTILSTQLAHLTIEKDHSGYLKDAADKGLFTQVLDFLFPW